MARQAAKKKGAGKTRKKSAGKKRRKSAGRKTARKKTATRTRKPAAPIVEQLAISAPVARVWAALTSSRDLGLITLGHVKMGSAPGSAFRWRWGEYEKLAPGRKAGLFVWEGKVLDSVPGSVLVLGPRPLAVLTVKGEAGSALVTVVQPAAEGIDSEDYEEGWADFLLKLKTFLETLHWDRETLARALVGATPRKALATFLDENAMKRLLPGKVKIPAKAGKAFQWHAQGEQKPFTGTLFELQRDRRMVFQWEATTPASAVAIEAQPTPFGTLVSIHHTGLWRLGRSQIFRQRMFWVRLLERVRCYHHFGGRIKAAK